MGQGKVRLEAIVKNGGNAKWAAECMGSWRELVVDPTGKEAAPLEEEQKTAPFTVTGALLINRKGGEILGGVTS